MITFEYKFGDGTKERVDAYYYKKEFNPRSESYEYIFYSDEDRVVRTVPELWLDPVDGNPREVS
jgi:hypothetical protein